MRAAVLGRPVVALALARCCTGRRTRRSGSTTGRYDALDVGAEDLPDLLAGLGEEWRGFSVTMPCKQAAVDVADVVEPLPRLLHAANTLVRTDGGWRAENTDVTGVGMALQLAGVRAGRRTPRSSAPAGRRPRPRSRLASLGAQHVDLVVRDPARAADLSAGVRRPGGATTVIPLADGRPRRAVVVSTVPIDGQPAVAALAWRAGQTVLDVLYAPWPTPLAERVTDVGGTVVGGLEVLFWQATVQVELITGQPAPIAAMRAALDAAVAPR